MAKKIISIREILGTGGGMTPHHEGERPGRPVEEAVIRKEEAVQRRGEGWPPKRGRKRPPPSSPEWGELGW